MSFEDSLGTLDSVPDLAALFDPRRRKTLSVSVLN